MRPFYARISVRWVRSLLVVAWWRCGQLGAPRMRTLTLLGMWCCWMLTVLPVSFVPARCALCRCGLLSCAVLAPKLDACSDYEGRRKIRARLRTVMAEQKGNEAAPLRLARVAVRARRAQCGRRRPSCSRSRSGPSEFAYAAPHGTNQGRTGLSTLLANRYHFKNFNFNCFEYF